MNDVGQIIESVRRALSPGREFYALHEPVFEGNEWAYTKECLDSGWVSSAGKFVDRFESELARFTGAGRAVAVVNGTAGLHVALRICGVGHGDEVLLPSLTFVATANAVSYCGATPHFVDCESGTLGVSPEKLEAYLGEIVRFKDGRPLNRFTGRPLGALVCVHVFGHPARLEDLQELCAHYSMPLVEDAAEALGSFYRGVHVGHHGRVGVLSFNGNKTISTGGGGALLTDDDELADRAKHLTTTAKQLHRWEFVHDEIGYNYRLPNLNAALGCAQLECLPRFLSRKARLAARYRKNFENSRGVFVDAPKEAVSNFWLNAIRLPGTTLDERNEVLARLNDTGFQSRPVWRPMHELPIYAGCPRMDLSTTDQLARELINLPSSAYPDGQDP